MRLNWRSIYRELQCRGGIFACARQLPALIKIFGLKRGFKYLYKWPQRNDYQTWIRLYDSLDESQETKIRSEIDDMTFRPKISIIMPVNDPPLGFIQEAIESIKAQLYPDWELCIAVDATVGKTTLSLLQGYGHQDSRIKVTEPLHDGLSAAANHGLALASGDYAAFLGDVDLLPRQALFYIARAIAAHPEAAMIYSDEDKISDRGIRYAPWFKCDFNYELLLNQNRAGQLTVYRRDLINDLGGFRDGFEGAQDYDLALRALERINAAQVIHIPRILYHQRTRAGQTAASIDAARRAVAEHLARTGRGAVEATPEAPQYNRVRYPLPSVLPLVSIIIPTRDRADLLGMCLDSLLAKTTYANYEIIIVDNGSVEASTQALFARLPKDRVSVIRDDAPFNYSRLNNLAVAQAKGNVICLMNNDIEILTPDWMEEMLSFASQSDIGCVGARLWFPDGRLQHAGVITGLGGVAGHPNKYFPKGYAGYFGRAILTQSMSAVTAACLMIRRDLWNKVQGFDEDLAVAFNDVDFCLRVKAAGYRNVWTPHAEMNHHESASRGNETTPEKRQRYLEEIERMKSRWGDTLAGDPAYNPNLTLAHDDFSCAWPPRSR
jgi:GT2 family glycosyltransferase